MGNTLRSFEYVPDRVKENRERRIVTEKRVNMHEET